MAQVCLPVVLSRDEVARLLSELCGTVWLMASLTYGSGLRLLECAELRVKDVHFERGEVLVRDGKGGKDRLTMLPQTLRSPLAEHLVAVKRQHDRDLSAGAGTAWLPGALAIKYPQASKEWMWQWVFPSIHTCSTREAEGFGARWTRWVHGIGLGDRPQGLQPTSRYAELPIPAHDLRVRRSNARPVRRFHLVGARAALVLRSAGRRRIGLCRPAEESLCVRNERRKTEIGVRTQCCTPELRTGRSASFHPRNPR